MNVNEKRLRDGMTMTEGSYEFKQIGLGGVYPGEVNPDHRWVLKARYYRDGLKYGYAFSAPHYRALMFKKTDLQIIVMSMLEEQYSVDRFEFFIVDNDAVTVTTLGNWRAITELDDLGR